MNSIDLSRLSCPWREFWLFLCSNPSRFMEEEMMESGEEDISDTGGVCINATAESGTPACQNQLLLHVLTICEF